MHEDLQVALVGDASGTVIQYSLKQGRSYLKVEKHYGNLKIGEIKSGVKYGNVMVFGGSRHRISIIDVRLKKVVVSQFKTAIQDILSLCVGRVKEKVVLSVSGFHSNYSEGKSDLFDIGKLINKLNEEYVKSRK